MDLSKNQCVIASNASTEFEKLNNELKKLYLKKYVLLFNDIASKINGNKGTFGTGYPFYVTDENFEGELPIIKEQLRYNEELLNAAIKSKSEKWHCAECLAKTASDMKDLKQVCKPCPNISNELKPRKVINRLPDMDLWMIYEGNEMSDISNEFSNLLNRNGLYPSDIDPIKTIEDMVEINKELKEGYIPHKLLPIDAHIMEYRNLKELIEKVPDKLKEAEQKNIVPYIPIHPLSRRKVWQKDDTAYNFIHDFLYSFSPYNTPDEMVNLLKQVRKEIADNYSIEQITNWVNTTGSSCVIKRNEEKQLKLALDRRIRKWKN